MHIHTTTSERVSPSELRITRLFDAPPRLVYAAWTTPELLMKWWAPASFGITLLSCEVDARPGGSYRFVFGHPASDQPMAFFGRYLEAVPHARLVWTNEESPEGSVTTLTLADQGGRTRLELRDVYPSVEALDAAIDSGSTGAYPEQFDALDLLLAQG